MLREVNCRAVWISIDASLPESGRQFDPAPDHQISNALSDIRLMDQPDRAMVR